MATKQHPTFVDAIEMVLSGASVSVATDFALRHGMEHDIQFYNPQVPEHIEAWRAINREWQRRNENLDAGTERGSQTANACEFTC